MKATKYWLSLLFLLLCSIVLVKSFFSADGYISPDSAKYLQLAQNLFNGKGLFVSDFSYPASLSYFSIWQPGYSFLIFSFAKIFSVNVFLASKILNLFLIASSFIIIYYFFKDLAILAILIFFHNSILEVFTFTWSETAFIFFILCLALSIYKYISTKKLKYLPLLLISSLSLFFIRYIGIFSLILILVFAIYFLFSDMKISRNLFSIFFLCTIVITLYFYNNFLITGYPTGASRLYTQDNFSGFILMVLKNFAKEFLFFNKQNFFINNIFIILSLSLVFLIYLAYILYKNVNWKFNLKPSLSFIFLLSGLIYLFSVIAIRIKFQMDVLDYRFLSPFTFLLFLSFIALLKQNNFHPDIRLQGMLLIIIALLVFPYDNLNTKNNYFANIESIKQEYSNIPSNSLVIYGNKHINYIRNDITVVNPRFQEPLDTFVIQMKSKSKAKNIYIAIPDTLLSYYNHPSSVNFIYHNKEKDFIKIK